MRLPITPAMTLMRELRAELRQLYPAGRIIVAVDGIDADGVDRFAHLFSQVIGEDDSATFHARLTDFSLARTEQDLSGLVADEDALRRALIGPFRSGSLDSATAGFQLETWDAHRDAPVESRWVTAPPDAVLIVSGTGILAPELRTMANWSVWLDTNELTLARRPGRSNEQPYTAREFAYLSGAAPAQAASVIIDNTDPSAPTRAYRDFC